MPVKGMKHKMIYKILKNNEWIDLQRNGVTSGAPIDIQDGYIHFSTSSQVEGTVKKYFTDVEGLFIAAVDDSKIADDLIWETARNNKLFPHLYRKLKLTEIIWCKPLLLKNGVHVFPVKLP